MEGRKEALGERKGRGKRKWGQRGESSSVHTCTSEPEGELGKAVVGHHSFSLAFHNDSAQFLI